MKYDFTSILDRTGKDAIAVEQIPIPGAQVKEGFDRIPMWVADRISQPHQRLWRP